MDTTERDELYRLFQHALALPAPERDAFVAGWLREAPALGRELAELLRQDELGGPLAPGARRPSLVAELTQELARDGGEGLDAPSQRILEKLAQRTPDTHYSILGELARGGMGAIFEVRDEDLGRRLAMKVALAQARKTGGSTPNLDRRALSRFLEEARVTGQLDHPGIVPVHELGVDGEGRLYFTMRLVEGRDLGEILALERAGGEGWTQTRVLGVLLKACEAMSYAHSKGVVHRDLKPANVMVGRYGEVYVMDWGLASAGRGAHVAPPGGAASPVDAALEAPEHVATRDGAILGTPGFMAPEQAAGRLDEIDERSDVYALGAMLYQLLTGRVPHDEEDEPVPFARLRRSRSGPPTPIVTLAPSAPAELVAICEKAMATEPSARYGDMGELGEDLRAFLEGRVVRAHATGAWEELRKWVRRNKALAASMTAGFLATLGGLVVALLQAQRAEQNAALAQRNAQLAETRSLEARKHAANAEREARATEEVADFMVGLFDASRPEVARGVVPTAEALLDRGVRSIEADLSSTPLVRARLQEAMGRSYHAMGLVGKAAPLLATARRTFGEELGEDDLRTLHAEAELAGLHHSEGRYTLAESQLRRVLEQRRRLLGERDLDTLVVEKALALVLGDLERTGEAQELYARVIAALDAPHASGLDDRARSLAITARIELGVLAKRRGELDRAEHCYAKAAELARDVWAADHPDELRLRNNIASLREAEGRSDEAEALYVETLRDQRRVCGVVHPDTLVTLNNLAVLYRRQDRTEQAEALYQEALAASREARGGDDPLTLGILENLARLRGSQGRHAEAGELYEEILDGRSGRLGPDHAETLKAEFHLAENYLDQGRVAEAAPLYDDSFARMRARLGERDPRTLQCANAYGYFLDRQGQFGRAAELYETAYEGRRAVLGETDPATLRSLENLAQSLASLGRLEEALALATDCVEKSPSGPDREYREGLRVRLERALAARADGATGK